MAPPQISAVLLLGVEAGITLVAAAAAAVRMAVSPHARTALQTQATLNKWRAAALELHDMVAVLLQCASAKWRSRALFWSSPSVCVRTITEETRPTYQKSM